MTAALSLVVAGVVLGVWCSTSVVVLVVVCGALFLFSGYALIEVWRAT